jgi:uncharacterized membrane protein HdeD (DUF308 family)
MKLFRISIIRAIAAIVVGVLLLKYDEAVLKGLTIAMGIMFLIAGVVSLAGWVNLRRKKADFRVMDDDGDGKVKSDDSQPMFPIVGLGSVLLGLILSLTQTADFLTWAMYLLGGVLILGGLNLMMNLLSARKMEPVDGLLWIVPALIVLAALFAMIKGLVPARTTTTILGVTSLVYALAEMGYSMLFSGIRKRYETTQAQVHRASERDKAGKGDIIVAEEV